MSVTFNEVKSLGEVFLSYLREYENTWMYSEEIDTKEKSSEFNEKMERIAKEVNVTRDKFEIEVRLQTLWNFERQANALEKIAATLNLFAEKRGLLR